MGSGKLAVIILTMNEEVHIERAINSIRNKADEIFVIDSMSTDMTVEIAQSLGATVFQKPWISYSEQLNWALSKLPHDVDWVFRLDADEYVLPETDIKQDIWSLSEGAPDLAGIICLRSMVFAERLLKYGGMHKKPIMRLFRKNKAKYNDRMIDEHAIIEGDVKKSTICIIDHCEKGMAFWKEKHRKYAVLEAQEFFKIREEKLNVSETDLNFSTEAKSQKNRRELYYSLPYFLRPSSYFIYRYFILFGFLDGWAGLKYTFFQAFWYRLMVEKNIKQQARNKY